MVPFPLIEANYMNDSMLVKTQREKGTTYQQPYLILTHFSMVTYQLLFSLSDLLLKEKLQ